MKKSIIQYLFIGSLVCLSACYEDDSTLGTQFVSDIEITGLTDQSIISYAQNYLTIQPQVKTEYPEDQLEYAWYIYKSQSSEQENGFRHQQIATTKDLNYEVNLPSGTYVIVFEVKSLTNDYSKTATMELTTSTETSKGFYILKETPDGNTDIDLYYNGQHSTNILTKKYGSPLTGKPRNISIAYVGEYIDTGTNETTQGDIIHILTEDNVYQGLESEELSEVFNNNTLFYAGNMNGEQPYTIIRSAWSTVYFSNTGIRNAKTSSFGEPPYNTGKLGLPIDEHDASQFIIPLEAGSTILYWSNADHKLHSINTNFEYPSSVTATATGVTYPDGLTCISAGTNMMGGAFGPVTVYFLCEQPTTKERYLLLINYDMYSFKAIEINEVIKLDPSLHIAQNDLVAINRLTATYIYSISEDNKLYAYSWLTKDEREFSLPGIPADEKINYISNQFFYLYYMPDLCVDDLIIGTHTGNQYKLYFYSSSENMNGGRPLTEGTVVTGEGKVKAVRYISSGAFKSGVELMGNPLFPTTD